MISVLVLPSAVRRATWSLASWWQPMRTKAMRHRALLAPRRDKASCSVSLLVLESISMLISHLRKKKTCRSKYTYGVSAQIVTALNSVSIHV
jgi:hypothetical protein